jgi:hypothetical protein
MSDKFKQFPSCQGGSFKKTCAVFINGGGVKLFGAAGARI